MLGNELILLAMNPALVQSLFHAFMFVWLLFVGGCIGSFMNVVIFRLPAGLSVAHPGSRCPNCCHSIRWHDNIPVISWLVLRAKCRDCKAPISVRYASVEALIGIIVVALAIVEVYIPTRRLFWIQPIDWVLIWGRFTVHVAVICTAVCAAFMEFDRRRVPMRLFYAATFLALVGVFAIRVPSVHLQFVVLAPGPISALRDMAIGIALGWVLAPIVLQSSTANRRFRPSRWTIVLIGGALGWQALLFVAVIAALVSLLLGSLSRRVFLIRRIPPSAGVVAALLTLLYSAPSLTAWITTWQTSWSGGEDRTGLMTGVIVVAAAASLILMSLRPIPSGTRKMSVAR